MEFQTPNTLAAHIANYLAEQIMTGQIRPAERIQEARVAEDLKVSRASVKEALYTLERWHLADITPRKGATATQLDAEHAAELYDVYMHLLIMLARRLCECWQERDRSALVAAIENATSQLHARAPDITEVVKASFDVMAVCLSLVNNPYLTEALSNFKPAVSRAYFFCADRYRQDLDKTRQFFVGLTEAVLSRDSEQAERQVEAFAAHQKSLIIQALSDRAPEPAAGAAI